MPTRRQHPPMSDLDTPSKLAALEVDVTGMKSDVAGLKTDLGALASEMRGGFTRIFERIEAQTSKGTNWSVIFGFAAILTTVVVALSTWANTYFGQSIAAAQREATRALEVHSQIIGTMGEMRRETMAQAIEAARSDERAKATALEVDRLRAAMVDTGRKVRHSAPRP